MNIGPYPKKVYCIFAFIFLNPLQQLDIKYLSINMGLILVRCRADTLTHFDLEFQLTRADMVKWKMICMCAEEHVDTPE